MKKTILIPALLLSAWSTELPAQNLSAFAGTTEDRASTRILYWDGTAQRAKGELAINYGRPRWTAKHERQLAALKGNYWRLGRDFWTVLDTNVDLKIGDVDIPAGAYYLALFRSENGRDWRLSFIDPEQVRGHRMDAFEVSTRMPGSAVRFSVSLEFLQSEDDAETLVMELSRSDSDFTDVTLRIAWGPYTLKTPIKVAL